MILSFYDVNTLFRQKEAEALKERMEREKRELQEFIGKNGEGEERASGVYR